MPRCGWLTLMAMMLCLSGCLWTEQTEQASFLKRLHRQTISPNHALIEVALLERPLGDEAINSTIWKRTDEQLVDMDHLDENGWRLGQIVGPLPGDFQQLLLSKRFCSNPQALIFPAGKNVPIYLGAILPQSSFEHVEGKSRKEVYLDQARYGLNVSARFTSDGRTTLTFTPKVENGAPALPFEADPDRSAWRLTIERPCKTYPDLTWEVTLGPNQYCIVGTRTTRERTLGYAAFTELANETGIQRLLVIRNCRSVTAQEALEKSVEDLVRADRSPPLALQATVPATRAKGH